VAGGRCPPATLVIQFLKVMVASDAVMEARGHAAILESGVSSRTDMDRSGRAFPTDLSRYALAGVRALREFLRGSPSVACYWARKQGRSSVSWLRRMGHLRGAITNQEAFGLATLAEQWGSMQAETREEQISW